jgi:hypothetical protein
MVKLTAGRNFFRQKFLSDADFSFSSPSPSIPQPKNQGQGQGEADGRMAPNFCSKKFFVRNSFSSL